MDLITMKTGTMMVEQLGLERALGQAKHLVKETRRKDLPLTNKRWRSVLRYLQDKRRG